MSRAARALPARPLGGVRGPFKGLSRLRVLDFTKLLPGPYATQLLAELGCRVEKLELPHFPDGARGAPLYELVNRGKKERSIDFREKAGLEQVLRLAGRADVLVEGFRPGLMDRVGLGAHRLRRLNKRLIYCSLVGYPPEGPWRRKAGHDLNFLAVSGFLGLQGAGASVPPTQLADLSGSLAAVASILAALLERQATGRGRRLVVSMAEAAHSWLPVPLSERAAGLPAGGPRWWNGAHPFYRLYETAGGKLAVAALEKPFALSLLDELGLPALKPLADEPLANADALSAAIGSRLRERTAEDWRARLEGKDVCVTPVYGLDAACAFQDWLRSPA